MESRRQALVRSLERSGIRDERVLAAIERVPRERFVPTELWDAAYDDRALPIGDGQTISQPYVVARMTELLDARPEHHVLDVGGGSGYQAAVLAEIVRDVVSVERRPELAEAESRRLADLGYTNVRVVHGDASEGFAEEAPYDRILVAAASPAIHPDLAAQCKPEGRIVAPIGPRSGQMLTVRHGDGRIEHAGPVQFVPLVGGGGFPE
ncbi:MAG: protein-L-isoaspartate(D-aspartate) O-methyltransferase [Dehalococcoidia bacterium]